jgi:AraC-like DNA-binding protein
LNTINILEILTKSISFSPDREQIKHVTNFFDAILEYICERYQIEFISNKAIQTTVAYIYKHYSEPITVPELAALVYQNPNYFIRLFNKNMGITPYQYIRDVRLGNAVSLLRQGFSVKEAALMVGFQNPSSLSHALKDVEK